MPRERDEHSQCEALGAVIDILTCRIPVAPRNAQLNVASLVVIYFKWIISLTRNDRRCNAANRSTLILHRNFSVRRMKANQIGCA